MPTYISLLHYTDQGIRAVKDTTKRAKAFQDLAAKAGFKVKDIYWTLGRYDVVVIIEAPNDETVTGGLLALSSLGNVRTETLRAYTAQEMERIIQRIPS